MNDYQLPVTGPSTPRTNLLISASNPESGWKLAVEMILAVPLGCPVVIFSASPVYAAIVATFVKQGLIPSTDEDLLVTRIKREVFVDPPFNALSYKEVMPVCIYTDWTKFPVIMDLMRGADHLLVPGSVIVFLPSSIDELCAIPISDLKWIPEALLPAISDHAEWKLKFKEKSFKAYSDFRRAEIYYLMHTYGLLCRDNFSVQVVYQTHTRSVALRLTLIVEPVEEVSDPSVDDVVEDFSVVDSAGPGEIVSPDPADPPTGDPEVIL